MVQSILCKKLERPILELTGWQCKVRAEVLRERVPKCRKAGQRPQSVLGNQICAGQRAWLQPGGCALMGCRCPISDGQKPSRDVRETGLKERQEQGVYLMLLGVLDIMAKESYLLQGAIYSNRQTIVNYYNGTGIGQ